MSAGKKSLLDPLPVWWWHCEGCGCDLPEGADAILQTFMGALPHAVFCRDCWGDLPVIERPQS